MEDSQVIKKMSFNFSLINICMRSLAKEKLGPGPQRETVMGGRTRQSYAGLEATPQYFLGLMSAVPSAGDRHPTQSY